MSSLFLPASPYFLLPSQKSGFSEKGIHVFLYDCVHRSEARKGSFYCVVAASADEGRTFHHRETALQEVFGGMVWP